MIVRIVSLLAVLGFSGLAAPASAQSDVPPLPPLDDTSLYEAHSEDEAVVPYDAVPVEQPFEDPYEQELYDAGQSAGWRASWIQQCSAAVPYGKCEDYLHRYEQSYETAFRGRISGPDSSGSPAVMWIRVPGGGSNCR